MFVEVGTFLGRSAAYMAQAIVASGKHIDFTTHDLWSIEDRETGAEMVPALHEAVAKHGSMEAAARAHLEPFGVVPVAGNSLDVVHHYGDESLDFVFLDDNHEQAHVARELEAWWPKIRSGGMLAGHDFDMASVGMAVTTWARAKHLTLYRYVPRSWAVLKGA